MKKGFLLGKEGSKGGGGGVDEDLKKAFADLSVKLAEGRKGMRECETEREALGFRKRKAELTAAELATLPDETPAFASLGRCFVAQSLPEALAAVHKEVHDADASIASLDKRKDYLQKSIKEQENNLRDMISQKQAQKS